MLELHRYNHTWMKAINMYFKIVPECKLFLAYGTKISFDTRMNCKMIIKLRANGEAFSTGFTLVSGQFFVDMFNVIIQATFSGKCTFALWTHKALVRMYSPFVILQLAPVHNY